MSGKIGTGILLTMVFLVGTSALAINKVAPKYSMVEFFGGYAEPLGNYEGTMVTGDFTYMGQVYEAKAGSIYEPGFTLGVTYGKLVNGRWLASAGLRYTRNKFDDPILVPAGPVTISYDPPTATTLSQWDLDINLNYQFFDLKKVSASPYVGLGLHPGFSVVQADGYQNENEFNFAGGVNFGADIKIWEGYGKRSFVTLSTINSWNFFSTNDRPRELTIGGGIKYFFKD